MKHDSKSIPSVIIYAQGGEFMRAVNTSLCQVQKETLPPLLTSSKTRLVSKILTFSWFWTSSIWPRSVIHTSYAHYTPVMPATSLEWILSITTPIILWFPCPKISQSRDSHHPLPQELHSLSFKNPDYRQKTGCKSEMVEEIACVIHSFFKAKDAFLKCQKHRRLHLPHPPFPIETILPLETGIFLLMMHKVKENLIHLLFHCVCEAKRNRQLYTSLRQGDGTQIQRDTCCCASVRSHSKTGING